jgi:putative transposase
VKQERFNVEQIVAVLKQAEAGVLLVELIRRVEISERTFYRWKKQYVRLEVDQLRQLKQLKEENTPLKQLVADPTLDKAVLQDVLSKNSRALAAPAGGQVLAWQLPGDRFRAALASYRKTEVITPPQLSARCRPQEQHVA